MPDVNDAKHSVDYNTQRRGGGGRLHPSRLIVPRLSSLTIIPISHQLSCVPKETITPSSLPRAIKMAAFRTPRLFCLCKINVYTLTNSQQHFDFQILPHPPFKSAICS